MPHAPEHVVDPIADPQQPDRETLTETFQRNPLEGLGATAGMFMPSWITGSRPETGLSLKDTTRSMIEFTPVVGDAMDLREAVDPSNDLDWLERSLAFFAGMAVFGGLGATVSMGAHSRMRTRHHQQSEKAYERLAETYRPQPVVGMAPAAIPDRPPMDREALLESVDDIKRRLAAAHPTTGIEQEKLAFTRGDLHSPRHLQIATARTVEQLVDGLWGARQAPFGPAPEHAPGVLDDTHTQRAVFASFLIELGTLMINNGLYAAGDGQQVTTHMGQMFNSALTDWSTDLDPDIFGAATQALAVYTQAKDAGLLVGAELTKLSDKFEDGSLFRRGTLSGIPSMQMASFISQVGDLSQQVIRFGGQDLTLTPNMTWNSFVTNAATGRVQGNLNYHVLQDSRYVEAEAGTVLDEAGLQAQVNRMDFNTLVFQFVQSAMAVENGVTSVAVSELHRQRAKDWYPQFNTLIEIVADRYVLKKYQVGAIISALSPRAVWDPDNVNWAILGAMEARKGPMVSNSDPQAMAVTLAELNEVRQAAGFPPVDHFKPFDTAMDSATTKVSRILAGMNPVEALRMLKTMSFLHNGLFPEGNPENSPFGRAVITADAHAFRGIMGFFLNADAPWMAATKSAPKVNWLTGQPGWRSVIGEDLIARLDDLGEISDDMALQGAYVEPGAGVPMFAAERTYDAAVRAIVIYGEILGIGPAEAQARLWQPVMEASNKMDHRRNQTVVWHDGVLKELEGRSPTSPSITDSLPLLDSALIDPMSPHVDTFTVASTNAFEPGVGILVATGPSGIRVYADPKVAGVVDQLRTARPIPAVPRLYVGKKEGLTLDPRSKPTATELSPVRWIPRISRRADLAVVQEASLSTSPASEFRTITDPSTRPGTPDVHSPGNYIVAEVAQGDTASIQEIISTNSFPLDAVEAPITHTAGHHRSSAKLTASEAETAFHRRASENPLNTQNWMVVPADSRLQTKLKRNHFSPIETYVKDPETGETRRAFLVFGLTAESDIVSNLGTFWTQDGQYSGDIFTPVSVDGVSMRSGGSGTLFQVTGDPGSTDFSMEYAADEAVQATRGPARSEAATPTRRTQIIVELGSIPDPGMVMRPWQNLDAAPSTVSLSGYFHGKLYADTTGAQAGHPMMQVGEYSFTNGNERMTQRAQHSEHLIEDDNYYTVWVPTSEALRLDPTHGTFPSKTTRHHITVERKAADAVVLDGETSVFGAGETLEINTEKLLTSTVDGDPVRVLAVTKDPETGQPTVLMATTVESLEASPYFQSFALAAQFHVGARGSITSITNDSLPVPPTMSTKIGPTGVPGPLANRPILAGTDVFGQGAGSYAPELAAVHEQATAAGAVGVTPVAQDPLQIGQTTGIHDPKYAAEINDVFAAVELLLRYGATPSAIRASLRNHPLQASLNGYISNMGPLLAAQRGLAGVDTPYWEWHDSKSGLDKIVREYYETGNTSNIDAWLIDATGQNQHVTAGASAITKKAGALDKDLQRVYKEAARVLIGDYSLVQGLPVNVLAGYRMGADLAAPDQEVHHELVMNVLGMIGALTERPGHIVPANAMRDLPGVAWFRERHGGVMFPGVAALWGSIKVGARHTVASTGSQALGTFNTPEYSTSVAGRAGTMAMDEDGKMVPTDGLSVDLLASILAGNHEWHTRYLRLVHGVDKADRIAMNWQKASQEIGNIGPAMTSIHEFGHGVQHAIIETGLGHVYREQLARIIARHGGVAEVKRQLGRYASTTWVETISESFDLVMIMGPDAPQMAIEIVDMAWDLLYRSEGSATLIEDVADPATTPFHSWGGPTEIGFWRTSMSEWETTDLMRRQMGRPFPGDQTTQVPPPKYEGGMIPYLNYLVREQGLSQDAHGFRRRKGKVVWSAEDLRALPDA